MSPTTPSWDQFFRPILNALRSRQGRPGLTGLHGSTTGFSLTLLARGLSDSSWPIVTATDEAAERLYEDLRFFHAMLGLSSEALALFPEWETLPYESTPPHVELIARRMRTLHRLVGAGPPPPQMERSRTTLVTSVPALVQRLLPASVFSDACLRIRPGDTLERETLASRLLRLGYRRGWGRPALRRFRRMRNGAPPSSTRAWRRCLTIFEPRRSSSGTNPRTWPGRRRSSTTKPLTPTLGTEATLRAARIRRPTGSTCP